MLAVALFMFALGLSMKDTHAEFSSTAASTGNYFTAADSFGPVTGLTITGVTANPGCSGAIITWTTGKPSSSRVEWSATAGGPYTSYFTDSTLVTDHSVSLSGMAPGSTWYYRVSSVASDGSSATSPEHSFTTHTGGKPVLSLSKYSVQWLSYSDYIQGILTVEYHVNNAGPDAYNLAVKGTMNTNGVVDLGASAVADAAAGGYSPVTIRYQVGLGVVQFNSLIYVTASDACGTIYDYPGPWPGA